MPYCPLEPRMMLARQSRIDGQSQQWGSTQAPYSSLLTFVSQNGSLKVSISQWTSLSVLSQPPVLASILVVPLRLVLQPSMLQLMNNKEVKPPVLAFGTEQVQLLKFDSQVILASSSSLCSGSGTLRVPITRYCLRSSGSGVRTLGFLVKS